MVLEALVFDVDGTLADTERDGHRPAFNLAFEDFGLDWHWDEALYGKLLEVTGGKERIRHYLEQHRPDVLAQANVGAMITELHKAKTRHYNEILASGCIPMRPGIKRLLQEARETGIRLAIATTTTPENVTSLLKYSLAADAGSWFEVIAAGDIVPAKKPAPDIYLYALDKLCLSPQQCLAIEDSENGLRASRAAGIPTLVTTNGYTLNQEFSGALAVLDHLGEPDMPATALCGDLLNQRYINTNLLHRWFETGF